VKPRVSTTRILTGSGGPAPSTHQIWRGKRSPPALRRDGPSDTVTELMRLRADAPPSRATQAVAAVLVAANIALFLLIAEDVLDGGGLISHDEAVLNWFVDRRTDGMITAARVVSAIGSFASLLLIGSVIGFWLWRRGTGLAFAVGPDVSLALAGLAASIAKAIFDRPRPPAAVHATHVAAAAFPSGHATDAAAFFLAASFILALTVSRHSSIQVLLVAIGMLCAGLVGVSRLVLGVHWLSDVIAGWALGATIAFTVVVTLWALTARRRPMNRFHKVDTPRDEPL
jgi:membrane-associated phospholipid phosphatase